MMELFIWPSEFGLPSMDIGSLQFMACSKFCAAPITFQHSAQPYNSPSGELPYFVNNETGEKIAEFTQFVEYLRNFRQDVVLDHELLPTQICDLDAFNALLKQKLRPAMLQLLWMDRYNYTAITHECYAQHLYFPYNIMWTTRTKKDVEKFVNRCNKTQQQLILDAIQALNLLSAKLSDNKYFCGDKPCSLDALVFGYLAPLLRIPLPNDRLQMHLAATPNLVRFVESILSIYMPLSDNILRELKTSRPFWQRRKDEAQKLMEETRIDREMRKNEREKQKESGLQRTIFFVFGSIVVGILFSIHTGILVIQKEEKKRPRQQKAIKN